MTRVEKKAPVAILTWLYSVRQPHPGPCCNGPAGAGCCWRAAGVPRLSAIGPHGCSDPPHAPRRAQTCDVWCVVDRVATAGSDVEETPPRPVMGIVMAKCRSYGGPVRGFCVVALDYRGGFAAASGAPWRGVRGGRASPSGVRRARGGTGRPRCRRGPLCPCQPLVTPRHRLLYVASALAVGLSHCWRTSTPRVTRETTVGSPDLVLGCTLAHSSRVGLPRHLCPECRISLSIFRAPPPPLPPPLL